VGRRALSVADGSGVQQGRVPSLLVGFAAETTSNVVSLIEEPLPLRREGLARG
jgi:hypothetical protein